MAALLPAPGIARVVIHGSMGNAVTANVMHVRSSTGDPWPAADLLALATGIRAAYVTNFIPRHSSTFHLKEVVAQDLSSDTGPISTFTGDTAGANGGVAFPAQVALCVSWTTDLHFRGGHCRSYFGGFAVTDAQDSTTWSSTVVTAWASAAVAFSNAIKALPPGGGPQLGMLSRVKNNVPRVPPLFQAVTGARVDTRIDTQRRRLGKDR